MSANAIDGMVVISKNVFRKQNGKGCLTGRHQQGVAIIGQSSQSMSNVMPRRSSLMASSSISR